MSVQDHWEHIYGRKSADQVSWYSPHLDLSLEFIENAGLSRDAAIIDVGGGASTLVDDLLSKGYSNLTVLDISATAIASAKSRLGVAADVVHWIVSDITCVKLPQHGYDFWHDRAVFHFLTAESDRRAYVQRVAQAVKPGGHVIVSTFGPEGPKKCSGLDVVRYDAEALHQQFGRRFHLVESCQELHRTPFGATQQFLYCYCVVE